MCVCVCGGICMCVGDRKREVVRDYTVYIYAMARVNTRFSKLAGGVLINVR